MFTGLLGAVVVAEALREVQDHERELREQLPGEEGELGGVLDLGWRRKTRKMHIMPQREKFGMDAATISSASQSRVHVHQGGSQATIKQESKHNKSGSYLESFLAARSDQLGEEEGEHRGGPGHKRFCSHPRLERGVVCSYGVME